MSDLPKISDAELEVMNILWNKSPMTSSDIIARISKKIDWKPQTIKTLIERLVKKNVLSYDKAGRAYLYYPKIERNEYATVESNSFLKKIFGGNITDMLAHFVDNQNLSQKELEELQNILDRMED